jgi:hypothetical protein
MGRVIGIWQGGAGPPQRRDHFVPVVALVQKYGLFDRPVLTPVCATVAKAEAVQKDIYLACRYFCSCGQRLCTRKHTNTAGGCPDGGQRVSVRADVVRDAAGKVRVQCTFFDNTEAMRQVVATYGPDPSKWPYQAKARKMKNANV